MYEGWPMEKMNPMYAELQPLLETKMASYVLFSCSYHLLILQTLMLNSYNLPRPYPPRDSLDFRKSKYHS
jgi:hypothetical protein